MEGPHKVPSLDSWRVFRIVSELVDGFETMTQLGPSIAFFGSLRILEGDTYYELCKTIAIKIAKKGFGIITGGGTGIMEAANRGAQEAKGKSCGLCIILPEEEQVNRYIDSKYHLNHRYFFIRKVMFVRYAKGFVVLPGGYGTLDEFFEAITLIQTKRIQAFPIYLVGKEYWEGLLEWLKKTVVKRGNLSSKELSFFKVTDDPDEIVEGIQTHYLKSLGLENF